MKSIISLFILSSAVFASSLVTALEVGQAFPKLTLEDQFGEAHEIGQTDTLVIASFYRDVSEQIHEFLNEQPKSFLDDNQTKYISDISKMPGIITKMFALPKMREYNYKFMLNREDDFKDSYDTEEGKLTVYRLNNGVVESIDFIAPDLVSSLFDK